MGKGKRKKPNGWKGFPQGYKSTVTEKAIENSIQHSKKSYFENYTGSRRMETYFNKTHTKLSSLIKNMKNKNITINEIGAGKKSIRHPLSGSRKEVTYEPYELADIARKSGKNAKVNAYFLDKAHAEKMKNERNTILALKQSGIKTLSEEEAKNNVKFGNLDIITATPAEKADVTVCNNVYYYFNTKKEDAKLTLKRIRAAFKNMVDSTKTGGYIVFDALLDKGTQKRMNVKMVSQHPKKSFPFGPAIYKKIK